MNRIKLVWCCFTSMPMRCIRLWCDAKLDLRSHLHFILCKASDESTMNASAYRAGIGEDVIQDATKARRKL